MLRSPFLKWFLGVCILLSVVLWVLRSPEPFYLRCFYVLLLCALLVLFRIVRGPTASDRILGIDVLGTLIVGFCGIMQVHTGRSWYIDIGIAWALQSFITTIAFSKFREGKGFED